MNAIEENAIKKFAVGIDIGGTNTRVALISNQFVLSERVQFLTNVHDPEMTMKKIAEVIHQMEDVSICGIGLSCPGPLDTLKGEILHTPNLKKNW